ncbi:Polynucleotidyl transferase, ribonuclease H-like superfamily protein [Arabidopsis thaliana]|uniref:Polynucleotidyl transferase, ribonuclease H-like superfamily protein n=1 Tax=Arabidopsis thaliana TaxID=3702 RepID=F4K355_ARATH|nr:Polynucleotidyl transferase, ribonuclease H-like superfamily protein [Arabidopsis thaliana]AED94885.1 Polynucleotidyl transferase, ribonuclease H-like superfamily protein [Arabidopsis thaliana]|eukprot:NP_680382.1 Polynucleotidyl transferase, ribonuclease H-like superfamily protein [Arabidopsis thaliana]
MTDEERHRRHLSASNVSQVYIGGVESVLHVFRDCPAQLGIWVRFVPRRRQQGFFSKSLFEWLYDNLCDRSSCEDIPWSTIFAVIIWWGWKWRCSNIFGENTKCRDRVKFVKEWVVEVYRAHLGNALVGSTQPRVERLIGWVLPCVGWVKVNTDGASRGNPGLASAGGVLRDCEGAWCGGFSLNIGRCSAQHAELWGVYYGLYFAWEKKVPRVELEVDSEAIVGFLKTGISDSHPLSFLVRLCHNFLQKDWRILLGLLN